MSDAILEDQNDKEEQRQIRLKKKRERVQSSRMNETEEQHQNRLEKVKEQVQSSRMNETEEQHQNRLEKMKERTQSIRANETEEQRQNRLEQQRKRSQANRAKKKIEKGASHNIRIQQQNIQMQFPGTKEHESSDGISTYDLIPNEKVIMKNRHSTSSPWPEPICRELKEDCLKQFLHQMCMSKLAEATCAVCNIRTPVQKSKSVPVSKTTGISKFLTKVKL
jgi:hypothetical protein